MALLSAANVFTVGETRMAYTVVGLRLGGRGKTKKGPSDDVITISQTLNVF